MRVIYRRIGISIALLAAVLLAGRLDPRGNSPARPRSPAVGAAYHAAADAAGAQSPAPRRSLR